MKKVVIASRKSDLARLQAQQVAAELESKFPDIKTELYYRESLGDQNQHDPLWKMPEKGVFTQDFLADLMAGKFDAVVHSWKDLPLERSPGTTIVGAPLRADSRDLFICKKSSQEKISRQKNIQIFSSSPRRAFNLEPFLKRALPGSIQKVDFHTVRGNISTRFRKLFESAQVDGLIVAKAAVDRLLMSRSSEFAAARLELRQYLDQSRWMVLPLKENPCAAAQGALAIEVRSDACELIDYFESICSRESTLNAEYEREVLGKFGGGCHQKIGVSVQTHPFGRVFSLRGESAGKILNEYKILGQKEYLAKAAALSWPLKPEDSQFFDRRDLEMPEPLSKGISFWISKADALHDDWKLQDAQVIWTAGLKSWERLAKKGIWVNGSAEGLGENWDPQVSSLLGGSAQWRKLGHQDGVQAAMTLIPTYELIQKSHLPDLRGKKYFFWMSISAFEVARKEYPEMMQAHHACGPGHTYSHLKRVLPDLSKLELHLDFLSWKNSLHS